VVVLVDQLRADTAERHLSGVMRLAGRGVVATRMRAAAPWTYPSVIGLMTGLYPQQHGAGGHVEAKVLSSFDPALPLLPKVLRAAGYRTAAFVANPFFQDFNPFSRSFDHYDIGFVGYQGSRIGDGKGVWTERMFADSVNAAVRAHAALGPPRGPEFTYVHYMDVHGPWGGAPFISEGLLERTGLSPAQRAPGSPVPWGPEAEKAFYEAAAAYVDQRVLELYELFHARYAGNLVFIVTSDHGRALLDDESVGDGLPLRRNKRSLHDFNLRVPFVVLPGLGVPGPVRVEAPCSNVDVYPTLLDWLGLEAPHALPGRSLLPAFRGGTADGARALFASVSFDGYRSEAVVQGEAKLVRWLEPRGETEKARRVYDLAGDPRELATLRGEPAGLSDELRRAALDHGVRFAATFPGLSPEQLERLRSVGYLR
jgi:arylsulfatase A-like enzyme